MDTFRKFGLWVCALLLGPLLITAVGAFAFTHTAGSPEYVKQSLREAAVYSAAGKQIKAQTEGQGVSEEKVNKILAQATNDETMQKVGEQAIDQLFSVLSGEQQAEQLSIDISPITSRIDEELVKNVQESIDQEIKQCRQRRQRGANIDCSQIEAQKDDARKLVDEAVGKDGVLADGNATLQDIQTLSNKEKDVPTQDITQAFRAAASVYQFARWAGAICVVLALACAAGIVLLSRDRLQGVRRAGIVILINGAIIVVGAVIGGFLGTKGITAIKNPPEGLASAVSVASSNFLSDFANYNRNLGLLIMVIGAGAILTAWIIMKRRVGVSHPAAEPEVAPKTPTQKN